jgi:hypothetical protein
MSANTGVAPQWTTTLAVAGQVSEVAGADPAGGQRQVQRGRARRDGKHVLGIEIVAHARLELGGAWSRRQPARTERLGDRLDLVLADRRRLERQEGLSASGELRNRRW